MKILAGEDTRKWAKRIATAALLAVVTFLVVREARDMNWGAVLEALRSYEWRRVAAAFAIAVPAYLACAAFDLVGRYTTGAPLAVSRALLLSFTGYFFSLNLGALIGGLAFRSRLYAGYGLPAVTIGQIIGLSIVTNWSGYVLVAGAVLAFRPPELPESWGVGAGIMRVTGFALLAAAGAYLATCAVRGGTRVRWRGSELELPTLGLACAQVALSMLSWGTIGAILTWLLPGDVSWFTVMPVVMISAVAGIWSHVPSGLGVTEVVFLALLGHRVPEEELLAAILMFRLVYYIAPFAAAIAAYLYLEATPDRTVAPKKTATET